jgi:hypothetical protein
MVSDAGKRVSDTYNLHKAADQYGAIGKWFAVALHDGTTDNTLYDSKAEAVRHQHHNEMYYAYVQVGPWSMPPKDADTFLALHRKMYDKNIRLADPDHRNGGKDLIKRATVEDQRSLLRSMFTRGAGPASNLIIGRDK